MKDFSAILEFLQPETTGAVALIYWIMKQEFKKAIGDSVLMAAALRLFGLCLVAWGISICLAGVAKSLEVIIHGG